MNKHNYFGQSDFEYKKMVSSYSESFVSGTFKHFVIDQ